MKKRTNNFTDAWRTIRVLLVAIIVYCAVGFLLAAVAFLESSAAFTALARMWLIFAPLALIAYFAISKKDKKMIRRQVAEIYTYYSPKNTVLPFGPVAIIIVILGISGALLFAVQI